MTRPSLFNFLLALLVCQSSLGAEIHVGPQGKDSDPGTSEKPLRTLAIAAKRARAGDTVILRGGVYRETLVAQNSGEAKRPITFKAAEGEEVVLTGTDVITGWRPHQGKILKCKIPTSLEQGFNQVFLDGRMLPIASFPNQTSSDPFKPTLMPMEAVKQGVVSAELTQPDGFWKGGFVVGGFNHNWSFQCATIEEHKAGRLTIAGEPNPWFLGKGQGYISGVLGALDSPGEWHVEGNTLYLWPPDGVNLEQAVVEVKQRTLCVDFAGKSNIVVKGLTLRAGSARVVGDFNRLEDCRVFYPSHFTFFPWSGYASDGGADKGHNGILVEGKENTIQGCKIQYSAGSGMVLRGSKNLVTRCEITDIDYSGTYSSGITIQASEGKEYGKNRITFNTIRRTGRDCLQFYGARGDDISYNIFSESGLLCKDLGMVYGWGRDGEGTRIAYNWVHDNKGRGPNPGIYLDNYNANFLVHHNVIWNCEAGVRVNAPAKGHRIYNNTLFRCQDVGARTYNQWPHHMPTYWKEANYGNIHQYEQANNLFLQKSPEQDLTDLVAQQFWPKAGSRAIDAGKPIPGITDGFAGKAPDLGAYESDGLRWKPGVDGTTGNENE